MNINDFSQNVLNDVEFPEQPKTEERMAGFGIVTILTIISIVVELVKLYKACKQTPEQVVNSLNDDNFIHRAALRRAIRKILKKDNLSKDLLEPIEGAFHKQRKQVTSEHIVGFFSEIS